MKYKVIVVEKIKKEIIVNSQTKEDALNHLSSPETIKELSHSITYTTVEVKNDDD